MTRASTTVVAALVLAVAAAGAQEASRWTQTAIVRADAPHEEDNFGAAVALSADGTTMAVGASHDAGKVFVFTRTGAAWRQQAIVTAANADSLDKFGDSVALSADGNTLVAGAYFEDGGGKGV